VNAYPHFDAIPDPVIIVGKDACIQFANSAAGEMLGYRPEELAGAPMRELVEAELDDRMRRIAAWLWRRPPRTLRMEHHFRRKDGRWITVEATVRRYDPRGSESVLIVTHRDVTPPGGIAVPLVRARRGIVELFDLVPVGLAINDEQRRIVAVNSALARMLGYPASALVGRRFDEFTHPDDVAEATSLSNALRRRQIPSFQTRKRYIRSDGSIVWANIHVTAVAQGRNGDVYSFGIAEDITDFKTGEAELRQQMAAQRRALIRETHHRIKNNLQGVVGLLIEQAELAPASAEAIRVAIHRLQTIALVHGLFATPGPGALNICDVTTEIGRAMQDQYARPIRVSICGSSCPVRMDPDEMVPFALILLEFVSNAVKHGPRGQEPIDVTIIRGPEEATVEIVNPRGALPAGFDLARGLGVGTGLSLVKSLLPPEGMDIAVFQRAGGGVVARIRVGSKLVVN